MLNIFQIFVAVFTFLFFLFKQKCLFSQIQTKKGESVSFYQDCTGSGHIHKSSDKSTSYLVLRPRYEWTGNNNNSCSVMPKYKRDPQISVDNEDIDYQPLD